MEVLSFKLEADAAVQPSLENGQKRQKLNHDLVLPASPRDWDNTVGNSGSNSKLNGDQEVAMKCRDSKRRNQSMRRRKGSGMAADHGGSASTI
ncbi:hypothetical protein J1N35_037368 [Gossypium stocksii]|uniref:Uncharacterized protein n=1 Tax=Gossypium stocksii TaxID=47602 RepID=A0A9D3UKN0_9ROSI|nr:hypothetical protein J1N35_037368 [Gossypium stocksii]